MTIGDKIKYYRMRAGLTQNQLASASEIHIVSIKKYETNKMQPQLPQIERIADALNIGTNSLLDFGNFRLSCETVGDFMGIIIMLCNSHYVRIDGERGDDGFLKRNTVSLKFEDNSLFKGILKLSIDNNSTGNELLNTNMLSLQITNPIVLSELIKWEKMNHIYHRALTEQDDTPDEVFQAVIAKIKTAKEIFELELQRSIILINSQKD